MAKLFYEESTLIAWLEAKLPNYIVKFSEEYNKSLLGTLEQKAELKKALKIDTKPPKKIISKAILKCSFVTQL